MLELLGTIWGVLQGAAGFLKGREDYPKLQDENGPLPVNYMQHARASADDLEKVWPDGHTICDDATGIPVARWSFSGQRLEPVTGFTIQGLPVYENVGIDHPVWSTVRSNVPAHLGTPGSEGQKPANKGGFPGYGGFPMITYCRGEKLAAKLGYFGPLNAGEELPENDPTAPGGGTPGAWLLVLLSVGSFAAGVPVLGYAASAAALLAARKPSGPYRGPAVDPTAPRPPSTRGQ